MDKEMRYRLLTIVRVGLLIDASIFTCLYLFLDDTDNFYLGGTLVTLVLSGIFNIIRRQNS